MPEVVSFTSYADYIARGNDFLLQTTEALLQTFWNNITNITNITVGGPTNRVITVPRDDSSSAFYRVVPGNGAPKPSSFQALEMDSGVPPASDETLRLNLWLFNGIPPSDTAQTYEVILRDFEFIPLGEVALGLRSITDEAVGLGIEYKQR